MALSAQTSRALHDTLGEAAADDLVKWMTDVDASRIELRELSELQIQRFREQSELQTQRFSALLDARFADAHRLWSDGLHAMATELRKEMHASATELRTEMHNRFNDLLKWSFVFWIGTLVSVAALVRFLR